jgi:UDP-hydrolysing UDP-N-acetyl-D-glucosamine 2-epimerase
VSAGASQARERTRPGPVRIAVLTTGRQDWGILRSVCLAIEAHPSLQLELLVGGMHLSPRYGSTVSVVRDDGFVPDAQLVWLAVEAPGAQVGAADPAPSDQAARALATVAEELRSRRPDALLLVGDRFETAAAALAATIERTPIVHIHGGEQTLGAFDDALRHAITKLAHLHLVASAEHARRVIALGEARDTVHVVGAPGLDNAFRSDLPDRASLAADLGIRLVPPVVAVTVHPATLDADPAEVARAVAATMALVPATYVVTLPNADPGTAEVARLLEAAASGPTSVAVPALGERRYWGLLRIADAILGNSSSALIEAPALGLPAVNVCERQAGRDRPASVLDAPADPEAIATALRRALTPAFRASLARSGLPAADGRAGERVANIIASWQPPDPPRKAPIRMPR